MLVVSLRDAETRAPWEELAAAVDEGGGGGDLLGRLEQILEMTLQTGRVRRVHGAESEQALLRLFHQTPRGAASRRATEAVNRTLASLAGQTIETLLFTSPGPRRLPPGAGDRPRQAHAGDRPPRRDGREPGGLMRRTIPSFSICKGAPAS